MRICPHYLKKECNALFTSGGYCSCGKIHTGLPHCEGNQCTHIGKRVYCLHIDHLVHIYRYIGNYHR